VREIAATAFGSKVMEGIARAVASVVRWWGEVVHGAVEMTMIVCAMCTDFAGDLHGLRGCRAGVVDLLPVFIL
jgi:hypothetical protein